MATTPRDCIDPHEPASAAPRRRPWPVFAVAGMLAAQMVGYIVLGLSLIVEVQGMNVDDIVAEDGASGLLLIVASLVLVGAAFFGLLTVLRRWRSGWLNALLVQTLSLVLGLVLYFGDRPYFTYIILAAAVLATFYLISPAVQAAFLPVEEEINGTTA